MRFRTIRARVAALSLIFALLLVGTISVATYILVARGMSQSASSTADRLAEAARRVCETTVWEATSDAQRAGLTGADAEQYVANSFSSEAPDAIDSGLAYEGAFELRVWSTREALPQLAWYAAVEPREPAPDGENESADRLQAIRSGETVYEYDSVVVLPLGMFGDADLGRYMAHIPLDVPGVYAAVLDIEYTPRNEEAVLDATRGPMIIITVVSLATAVLITMLTTGWTLSLVENLRRTADSVDIGQLDVRLPEQGENEVAELARSLNRLIESLQRRNEAQARFIADASHELATPVAGIRGYVNILRAWGAEDPSLREEAVSAIDRESRRMARLCSDLLSVIRNEEVVEYRQIRYDINAVCREVLANAATRYIENQLEFSGPTEGPLWLWGDPDRIEESLGILVDNACKYTPSGGSVSISTRRSRDRVVVEISDTGVGIPEKDLPSIFDRFYRSDVSRSKETGGFGLGLAIAKHIVDASGGTINVRSVLGSGTTFEVTLPRQKRQVRE